MTAAPRMTREEFEIRKAQDKLKNEERRLKRERSRTARYAEMIGWRQEDMPRLRSLLAKSGDNAYWVGTFNRQIAEAQAEIDEFSAKCPEARELLDTNPALANLHRARLRAHNAGDPRAFLDNWTIGSPLKTVV